MSKFNPQKYFKKYDIWHEDDDIPNLFRNVINDVVEIDYEHKLVKIYEGRDRTCYSYYVRLPKSNEEFDEWISKNYVRKSFK